MVVGDVSAQTVRTMEAVVEDDAVQADPVMQRRLARATTLDRNQYTVVGRHCKSIAIDAIVISVYPQEASGPRITIVKGHGN